MHVHVHTCDNAMVTHGMVDVGGDGAVLPLDKCSPLNFKFWHRLYALLQTFAPTHVPLPKASRLVQRLQASHKLQELFSLVGFAASAASVMWKCCALSHDNTVTILCLPCGFFYSSSSSSSPNSSCSSSYPCSSPRADGAVALATPSIQPLCLPVVLVRVQQRHVLDPLSSSPSSPSPSLPAEEDSCHLLNLLVVVPALPQEEEEEEEVEGQWCQVELLSRVASLHKECYLETLHYALSFQLTLCPQDFLLGLQVCRHSTAAVDVTPLLSALCPHSLSSLPCKPELGSLPFPLETHVLCQLLGSTLSKHKWTVCVRPRTPGTKKASSGSSCSQCSYELNQVFLAELTKLGFKAVPGCGPGYFWLNSSSVSTLTRRGKDQVRVEGGGGVCVCV